MTVWLSNSYWQENSIARAFHLIFFRFILYLLLVSKLSSLILIEFFVSLVFAGINPHLLDIFCMVIDPISRRNEIWTDLTILHSTTLQDFWSFTRLPAGRWPCAVALVRIPCVKVERLINLTPSTQWSTGIWRTISSGLPLFRKCFSFNSIRFHHLAFTT